MKKQIVFLFIYVLFASALSAQELFIRGGGGYSNPYALYLNNTYNCFFSNHKNIKQIVVGYERDIPVSVYIYVSKGAAKEIKETYDLGFAGDKYLLEKKYKYLIIPTFPDSKVKTLPALPNAHCQNVTIRKTTTIFKDSIKYEFDINCSPGEREITYAASYIGAPAKFIGDIGLLAKRIKKKYMMDRLNGAFDSVLVFKGTVGLDSTLRNLELIAGNRSKFSTVVQKELESSENKWLTANIGGRFISVHTRFYICLNKNGNITILMPRRLLNGSGI